MAKIPDHKIIERRLLRDWQGFRGDDEIVECDIDRKVIKRDNKLLIFSDEPVSVTI